MLILPSLSRCTYKNDIKVLGRVTQYELELRKKGREEENRLQWKLLDFKMPFQFQSSSSLPKGRDQRLSPNAKGPS